MDTFLEYLVKQKKTGKTVILKILIVFGTVLLSLIFLLLCFLKALSAFAFFFLLAIAGVIYGAWLLFRTFRVEFEYIVTNGEMDVDKIFGQQKRKRLVTVNFREMEIMAPMGGEHKREFENQSIQKTIDASVSQDEKGAFFIIASSKKFGRIRLVFTPDERIIKSAQTAAPRKVFTV
jgi:hypothetical protein